MKQAPIHLPNPALHVRIIAGVAAPTVTVPNV